MSRGHLTEVELTEYADGAMLAARMDRAEEHLRQCDTCAAALAASRQAVAAVSRLAPRPVSSDLRARVRARLATELEAVLSCGQAAPLLHEHVDHCLSPMMGLRLQRHLESCTGCRQELARLEEAAHLVRTLTPVTAPAWVRERVAGAARRTVRRAGWELRLRPALAVAGAAAVVTLALALRPVMQPVSAPSAPVIASLPERPVAPAEGAVVEGPPITPADEAGVVSAPAEMAVAVAPAAPVRRVKAALASRGSAPKTALAAVARAPRQASPMMVAIAHNPVPAAMQALKTVAASVEYDRDARRAMDEAAARYAVLNSEETLDRVPELATPAAAKAPEAANTGTPVSLPIEVKPGHNAEGGPDGGELTFGPLV